IIHQTEASMRAFTAAFLDDTFGVTVGHAGDPLYTTDGGQTWISGENVSLDLDGLDIVDENVIWASGRNGQVRVSTDGGRTWQAASSVGDGTTAPYIGFLDAQTGWVATRNSRQLWATSDGGQTWTEITLPGELTTLAGISLRTAMDGYLLDDTGVLFITQDGSQNWSWQTLGLDSKIVTAYELPLTAIRFTDADRGLVVFSLEGGGGKATILRTTDGGETWEQEDAPVPTGTLHLTHDGETLTTIDRPAGQIVVLRHKDG
ncbi:MAG: hypothetical protein JXA14_10975, partial [Anaerolineae bacterium]|nr:hypothetical protein [Anaerolineae bacterium]